MRDPTCKHFSPIVPVPDPIRSPKYPARFSHSGFVTLFVMPLSQEQVLALKNAGTKIMVQMENPKKVGSKAWDRYEKYKHAKTIGEATHAGANWQDVSVDFEKGFLKVMDSVDEEMPHSTKRPALEGTPDRESQARASTKVPPSQMIPQVLVPEVSDPVSKVEMSAATIAALRLMMREEFANSMGDMETRLSGKLDAALHEVRAEVAQERDARRQLEERVRQLEEQPRAAKMPNHAEEEVDKSVVVIGGFADDVLEQAEEMVRDLLAHVGGFKDVEIVGANSNIALATFDSPMHALKFVRNQRKHPMMMSNKLWAAENRSKNERNRCKILSKAKKFMIELGRHSPKDVVVSYKMFRVITRVNGKLIPTANVSEDLVVEWLNEAVPDASVREALDGFIGDME